VRLCLKRKKKRVSTYGWRLGLLSQYSSLYKVPCPTQMLFKLCCCRYHAALVRTQDPFLSPYAPVGPSIKWTQTETWYVIFWLRNTGLSWTILEAFQENKEEKFALDCCLSPADPFSLLARAPLPSWKRSPTVWSINPCYHVSLCTWYVRPYADWGERQQI
jgi:hypothetical protein